MKESAAGLISKPTHKQTETQKRIINPEFGLPLSSVPD
jgi:hypothetical protein